MKVRRFYAAEMRDAIRQVRAELGPDAVILSERQTEAGLEVCATADYQEDWREASALNAATPKASDLRGGNIKQPTGKQPTGKQSSGVRGPSGSRSTPPVGSRTRGVGRRTIETASAPFAEKLAGGFDEVASPRQDGIDGELRRLRELLEDQLSGLAWGEIGRRNPLRAALLRNFLRIGLAKAVAEPIAAEIEGEFPERQPGPQIWQRALSRLIKKMSVSGQHILKRGGLVAVVGPTGVGKTTTIAKLAAQYRMVHGSDQVALLTTDDMRVGAHAQLRTYGELMGVPVAVCTDSNELVAAYQRHCHRGLVLIDTPGLSQRDARLGAHLASLARLRDETPAPLQTYLVLAATTAYPGLQETVNAYQGANLSGCIATKLDETASLGGLISVAVGRQLSIAFVSHGQRVPDDLAQADPTKLVAEALRFARESESAVTPPRAPISEEAMEMAYGGRAAYA